MLDNIISLVGLIVGLIVGLLPAFIGVSEYRRSVTIKRAEWLSSLYQDFYKESDLKMIREMLDSEGKKKIEEAIQKEFYKKLSKEEETLLLHFTDYLNFFEFMLYLKKIRMLEEEDIKAMFDYYIKQLSEIKGINQYLKNYGYENLDEYLFPNKIFIYGTLENTKTFSDLIKKKELKYVGKGKILAKLYDLGEYPGAVENEKSKVKGRIYEAKDICEILPLLDKKEEFDPDNPSSSLFIRKVIPVFRKIRKPQKAFVYIYNGDTKGKKIILGGDWKKYKK